MPRDHQKLRVFHQANQLAVSIYRLTSKLPASERFGLQGQLRRAAVSIPSNIVEGCGRKSVRDYERFLDIAHGSAVEVRYLLDLVTDLGTLAGEDLESCRLLSDHVARALQKLHSAVARLRD
jgi:four helix bundle protein